MPFLDLSELSTDPDFVEEINVIVIRRPIVMVKGRPTVPNPVTYPSVTMSVQPGGNSLEREDDKEFAPKTMNVFTKFRLQTAAPGYLPDYVIWNGDNFIVQSIDDYSRWGQGYIDATIASVDSLDLPPKK